MLDRGIMEIDPDRQDLERMLLEYWSQPNTKQLNIRIPADVPDSWTNAFITVTIGTQTIGVPVMLR